MAFWEEEVFLGAPRSFVHVEGTCFACLPRHVFRDRVTQVCLLLARPSGGGWWSIICVACCEFFGLHKKTTQYFGTLSHANGMMPHMLALVERPSLRGWCIGLVGHSGVKLQANVMYDLFSPIPVFMFGRNSGMRFGGLVFRHLWTGRSRNLGPAPQRLAIEVFDVGRCLKHGDLDLDAQVDFHAVVEHRLIPAGVRSEWARLRLRVFLRSGLLLVRILPMLVMLELEYLV